MDIMLQRILSLVPRKPNGDFVHGALKEFAESIGLKNGNVVNDWIGGRSKSYKKKLHEIAAKYDVSVEWLSGETDIKKTAGQKADGSRGIGKYDELTPENQKIIDALIDSLLKSQSGE